LVYQTNGTEGFYYNTSTTTTPSWLLLSNSVTGGSGAALNYSTTVLSGGVPANGPAKIFEVSITLGAGQRVLIIAQLIMNNNGANAPTGTNTTMEIARNGTGICPYSLLSHANWATHHQTWMDEPGAGTFLYQVYGDELHNRTDPTSESGFIFVISLN